jgi:ABC-type Fe3+-hydroxamate transport system substrate-binding protein
MLKRITLLLFVCAIGFSACTQKKSGCDAAQACTADFRSVGVKFVDKEGNPLAVKDLVVTNLRTNTAVIAKNVLDPGFSPDFHTIATDSNKDDFSTDGDEIKITATSTATNKTATATLKISGGCNCHINKLSGPEKIVIE